MLVAVSVLVVVETAVRWETVDALTNCSTSSDGLDGEEVAALQAINAFRAQNGKGPYLVAPSLNRMAAWKSEDSSASGTGFGHTDSLGRAPYSRAIDCGYPGGAAENIAYGGALSGVGAVQLWIGSDGHRANLLGSYAVIGIGHNGGAWTANFGFTLEPGSFPVPGAGGSPTSTPTPAGGGNNPNPTNTSTGGAATATSAPTGPAEPGAMRTALPGGKTPTHMLPNNVPVKRAMMQMVSSD